MKSKGKLIGTISLILAILLIIFMFVKTINNKSINTNSLMINLNNLTYQESNTNDNLKTYTQEEFSTFLNDYENNALPKVYITKFLFDGISMYKPYDLDDFIEEGNDTKIDALEINAININTTGDIELSGEITGAMLAINTNNIKGDINILLNNVKIDTDSKKVPVIYAYNKDITYTDAKVTIKAMENTNNYLEGGKLKKVSLIPSEKLSEYTNKYSNENKTNYETYTNYYGIYTENEINNILFATTTADNEDLADGDPYYFYKASGAISSDIDLYFEGSGYLEITSKNKEGVETKGSLSFLGGIGDYVINAEDDCLNTTTDSKENSNVRNTLTIDVKSMYAIVSNDADEGDAIDSNGELIINNGLVVAIAKPGSDAGIDSENGTYINGGRVLATGDMYDEINSASKQNYMVLSFASRPSENDLITLLDENDKVIFSYLTDRTYSNLIYSDSSLSEGTYYLYQGGTINGINKNGFYNTITSYEKGTELAYNVKGIQGGMQGGTPGNNNGTPPEMPSTPNGNPPEKPNDDNMNRGTIPNGKIEQSSNSTATNKEFTIEGISNLFSGISTYIQ